jgi:hypothetical protein
VRIRYRHLSVAAVATMFAFTGAGGSAVAVPDSGEAGSSSAEITLEDCMLESSKEISYVDYLADGESVTKDEEVEAESLDLTTVEGIEDVDSVEVKAGTTVESFDVTCAEETEAEDGLVGDEGDEDAGDGEDETGERRSPNVRSTALITLSGCVLESSKDISYVEYLTDGTAVTKDETVGSETFDLSTVEGIEEFDSVEVKAGTTVESFPVECAEDTTVEEPSGTEGSEDGPDDDTDGTEDGTTGAQGAAAIALNGCVVESTKDISYIEYFDGGSSVTKDESMNSETFDLSTVDGIEEIDSVEVKAGTTVESFDVTCAFGESDGDIGGGTSGASGSPDADDTEESEEADDTEEAEVEDTEETEETEVEGDAEETEESDDTEESDEDDDEDENDDEDDEDDD